MTDDTRHEDETGSESPPSCHRRGCEEPAMFEVLERYQEETGQGPVEARAHMCQDHADEESPTNLDAAYEDYVFRVKLIDPTGEPEGA